VGRLNPVQTGKLSFEKRARAATIEDKLSCRQRGLCFRSVNSTQPMSGLHILSTGDAASNLGYSARRATSFFQKPRWCPEGVTLQVHDDLCCSAIARERLATTLGAVADTLRIHHHLRAEAFTGLDYAVIICCHIDRLDAQHSHSQRAMCVQSVDG